MVDSTDGLGCPATYRESLRHVRQSCDFNSMKTTGPQHGTKQVVWHHHSLNNGTAFQTFANSNLADE
eukprot:m.261578 g.261578  ORF g.261578 m.261578 type:complete len:67 (-) comp15998_c0_seq19:1410-1610(-)